MIPKLDKDISDCFQKQIHPDKSEFECFFHYSDEGIFGAGFKKGYELAMKKLAQ